MLREKGSVPGNDEGRSCVSRRSRRLRPSPGLAEQIEAVPIVTLTNSSENRGRGLERVFVIVALR